MTDNEMIKALEDCSTYAYHYCSECGFKDGDLLKVALDLINRQKAEIARLQKIEANILNVMRENIEQTKAEAVKETIEAVKSKSSSAVMVKDGIPVAGTRSYQISEVALCEIVKEMVGEAE